MRASRLIEKICISAFFLVIFPLHASAAIISFSGELDVVDLDTGTGVYAGLSEGTPFTGFIDDATFSGEITDGTTFTSTIFSDLIAAGGLTVSNDFTLDAEEAALLNALLGDSLFNAGDIFDGINIEGDAATASDGRIEIGLSYLFDADTFNDESLDNYPFDPDDVLVALFFIYEENDDGEGIYSAVGELNAVPLPASIWLFGVGIAGLIGLGREKILK